MRVYLAGPDVFLPDPVGRGAILKRICAAHGLVGVFPLDDLGGGDPAALAEMSLAFRIARRNELHIEACAALIANLTPFRGPSADVGTVYELGFMRALGRPVFGWSNVAAKFAARTRAFVGGAGVTDQDGLLVEDFGIADNLMIEGGIAASGGAFFAGDVAADQVWQDLAAFERCVAALASLLSAAG
jgi:nucleoside 2-deoxyribosyltransferase